MLIIAKLCFAQALGFKFWVSDCGLCLQVVFHLQTRSPPILPPICELFDLPADSLEARPLHQGRAADMALLQVDEFLIACIAKRSLP